MVDGVWVVSENANSENDDTGNENNVILPSDLRSASSDGLAKIPEAGGLAFASQAKTTVMPSEELTQQSVAGEPGIFVPENAREIQAFSEYSTVDPKSLNEPKSDKPEEVNGANAVSGIVIPENPEDIKAFGDVSTVDPKSLNEEKPISTSGPRSSGKNKKKVKRVKKKSKKGGLANKQNSPTPEPPSGESEFTEVEATEASEDEKKTLTGAAVEPPHSADKSDLDEKAENVSPQVAEAAETKAAIVAPIVAEETEEPVPVQEETAAPVVTEPEAVEPVQQKLDEPAVIEPIVAETKVSEESESEPKPIEHDFEEKSPVRTLDPAAAGLQSAESSEEILEVEEITPGEATNMKDVYMVEQDPSSPMSNEEAARSAALAAAKDRASGPDQPEVERIPENAEASPNEPVEEVQVTEEPKQKVAEKTEKPNQGKPQEEKKEEKKEKPKKKGFFSKIKKMLK